MVLGDYNPEERTGPAIWMRCVVDRAIRVDGLSAKAIPVLYLPGVKRTRLRAGEDCPDELKPLVELAFRGVLWHHPNNRDWSVTAFLSSPTGLKLDIAGDGATRAALRGALREVALTPVDELGGRRLDAADFNRMAGVDPRRDILRWMADPEGFRRREDDDFWRAFRDECHRELEFDPETDLDVTAGAKLGEGSGPWARVWTRYTEAPSNYDGVPEVVERSRSAEMLAFDRER